MKDFRIKTIKLENYKCFKERELNLNDKFTLLVGNNGTGKTTILDSIAIAIGGFLNGFGDIERNDIRSITPDEVRRESIQLGNTVNLEAHYPVKVYCESIIDDEVHTWVRYREDKGYTKFMDSNEMRKFVKKIQISVASPEKSGEVVLPVFAYHGTGRLWAKTNKPGNDVFDGATSRYLGYKNCLNPISNENLFTEWFKSIRRIEIDEGIKSVELSAVCQAIEEFIGGNDTKIRYNLKSKQIEVTLADGNMLPFHMLSDGYRNAIGMVADTAFRMVVLNPQLKEYAIKETSGVILIDEIELHLHPQWQLSIVDSFKKTFPKLQIIATTHAPIVVSSCNDNEVVRLNDNGFETLSSTYGWLAEDVIRDVMGLISSRHPDVEEIIQRYKELYTKKLDESATTEDLDEIDCLESKLFKLLPSQDPIVTLTQLEAAKEIILGVL